jgi:hypothetical protein
LGGVRPPSPTMDTVVGAEARLRAQNVSACDTLLQQKRQDLLAQEVTSRTGIFVKMNRNLLGWARIEHSSTYTGRDFKTLLKTSLSFPDGLVRASSESLP